MSGRRALNVHAQWVVWGERGSRFHVCAVHASWVKWAGQGMRWRYNLRGRRGLRVCTRHMCALCKMWVERGKRVPCAGCAHTNDFKFAVGFGTVRAVGEQLGRARCRAGRRARAVVIHAHCGGFESGHMQAGRRRKIVWTAAQCCAHKV